MRPRASGAAFSRWQKDVLERIFQGGGEGGGGGGGGTGAGSGTFVQDIPVAAGLTTVTIALSGVDRTDYGVGGYANWFTGIRWTDRQTVSVTVEFTSPAPDDGSGIYTLVLIGVQ